MSESLELETMRPNPAFSPGAYEDTVATWEALYGKRPVVDKWTFSTNGVAICGKHGIPTIGFGPGDEVYAHAPDERTPIDHLEKASAFYAMLPWIMEEHL